MLFILFALLFSNVVAKNEDYMGLTQKVSLWVSMFVSLLLSNGAKRVLGERYKVYNVKFRNQTHQENLHKIKSDGIDFLRKPCIKYNVVGKAMVPPSHFNWFEEKLNDMDIGRDISIEDVYEYLRDIEPNSLRNEQSFDFDAYYRYDAILDHLYTLEEAYVNSTISLETITFGVTEEDRSLVYIKLSNGNEIEKPVVVIEAGINPREWITIPSALNVLHKLLEDDQRYLLDAFTWIVVPVLNPDGYEYTHTNLRLWSKSRSLNSNLGFICPGVNINRNFDIDWLVSGSSSSPCSHLYAGTEPFSEIETRLIKSIIEDFHPLVYISLQNNGNFITFPWSYEKAASGLFRSHYLLGLDIVSSLEGYKLDAAAIAYGDRESGTSTDYARRNRVYYTYNIGVEGTGEDGVIVPEENIKEKVDKVWVAVKATVDGIQLN